LAAVYGDVQYDDINGSWVRIPRFPLPPNWMQGDTDLLIELPSTYPFTPPKGFFTDKGLRTRSGVSITHYFEGDSYNKYSDLGWAWFCVHIKGEWRPSASLMKGDNLLKFTELISAIFANPPTC